MVQYWLYRLATCLCRIAPRGITYWVGLRIADLYFFCNRTGRAAVMDNLRQIFQGLDIQPARKTLRGFARKTFQHFGKYLIDFFRFSRLSPAHVANLVSLQNMEYIEQGLQYGRGLLTVTAHFGNWELGGAVMTALGYRVHAVVLPERKRHLKRLLDRQRMRRGVNLLPLGQSGFSVVRCLKRNEIVAVLGDRDFSASEERVPFFGAPARIPIGPAKLSIKTGAPIVVGVLLRQVDDTFLLRMHPPLLPEVEKTPEQMRQRMIAILEEEIGRSPYQWFLFQPFWGQDEADGRGHRTEGEA